MSRVNFPVNRTQIQGDYVNNKIMPWMNVSENNQHHQSQIWVTCGLSDFPTKMWIYKVLFALQNQASSNYGVRFSIGVGGGGGGCCWSRWSWVHVIRRQIWLGKKHGSMSDCWQWWVGWGGFEGDRSAWQKVDLSGIKKFWRHCHSVPLLLLLLFSSCSSLLSWQSCWYVATITAKSPKQ